MAVVTYNGPGRTFTFARLTFRKGEARPVPAEALPLVSAHPWFDVESDDQDAPAQEPKKRGRPRKA